MMEDALQPASPFIPKDFPLTDEYGVIPSCVPTRQWVYNIVRWPLAMGDVERQRCMIMQNFINKFVNKYILLHQLL